MVWAGSNLGSYKMAAEAMHKLAGVEISLLPHPVVICVNNRASLMRASAVVKCQSAPRCRLFVLPSWTTSVRHQQNICPANLLCESFQFLHHLPANLTLVIQIPSRLCPR